ncbi:DNA replication complex GINS protein SLD5 [Umbelopsis nana]
MLYQTEMERIKFLIRNYLRTRLYKIEKYTTYILNRPDVRELLSDKEIQYAQSYSDLLEKHYSKSFLGSLPQSQQDVNEKINTLSSVSVPDDYSAVIVRAKEELGFLELESAT